MKLIAILTEFDVEKYGSLFADLHRSTTISIGSTLSRPHFGISKAIWPSLFLRRTSFQFYPSYDGFNDFHDNTQAGVATKAYGNADKREGFSPWCPCRCSQGNLVHNGAAKLTKVNKVSLWALQVLPASSLENLFPTFNVVAVGCGLRRQLEYAIECDL